MKRELVKFLVLAALALGAPPAYSAYWQWSKTAGTNSSADPTINWAEGMSPSSINDSARAMMARMAEYRDDISGSITTTGTATAYAVTTNQGLSATPNDGQLLAFTPNVDNGVGVTLRADGGTIYPIQTSTGVAVGAATLITGTPYSVKFSVANSAWMLRDFYGNAFNVPLGGMLPYTGVTPPNSNFIFPAGQCISTTTYATYWVLLGSPASGGCGGGTFPVIDLRGRMPIPLDNLNGTSAGRITTAGCGVSLISVGSACNGTETFALGTPNLPAYTPTVNTNTITPTVAGSGAWAFGGNPGSAVVLGGASGGSSVTVALASTLGILGIGTNLVMNAQGGTSTPVARIGPAIGVTYLLRVI